MGFLTPVREAGRGTVIGGRFDWGGGAASRERGEAREGLLAVVGNHRTSVKAQGGLTASETSRAGAKAGLSDLAVASGSAVT